MLCSFALFVSSLVSIGPVKLHRENGQLRYYKQSLSTPYPERELPYKKDESARRKVLKEFLRGTN